MMENAKARLVELEAKDSLTDAEMQELIMLKPSKIVALPGLQTIGVSDLNQAMANLVEIANRSKHALQHNCYIEVISLRLQHIEVFLRIYWVAQNRYGKIYTTGDKRTFGQVIEDCASVGMKKELGHSTMCREAGERAKERPWIAPGASGSAPRGTGRAGAAGVASRSFSYER